MNNTTDTTSQPLPLNELIRSYLDSEPWTEDCSNIFKCTFGPFSDEGDAFCIGFEQCLTDPGLQDFMSQACSEAEKPPQDWKYGHTLSSRQGSGFRSTTTFTTGSTRGKSLDFKFQSGQGRDGTYTVNLVGPDGSPLSPSVLPPGSAPGSPQSAQASLLGILASAPRT